MRINQIAQTVFLVFSLKKTIHTIVELTPLHKSGDVSEISNYRPISIISAVSKIFEKIMYSHIYELVSNHIVPHQHGFAKNKSTISNLAEYVNYLSVNIANGGQIDSIYTDFAKAFDKVNHRILLRKLNQFPINNCIKAWIYSFLTNRTQIVCINGTQSRPIHPTSSVPQGCVLSTLLFSLFINDLSVDLLCHILLFADDVKIFMKIKSINDCYKLQRDINVLANWCNTNCLHLNINKCSIISFTRRKDVRFQYFNYTINNVLLNRSQSIKDLGVTFDAKLSFSNHIQSIILRSSKLLGFIFRSLKPFQQISSHINLFYSYIYVIF